nr:MAG: hypothetical protein CM15mV30_0970 [uncultured marine virus]
MKIHGKKKCSCNRIIIFFLRTLEATAIGIGLLQAKLLSDYLQADKQKKIVIILK